jgi:hypothetical protein
MASTLVVVTIPLGVNEFVAPRRSMAHALPTPTPTPTPTPAPATTPPSAPTDQALPPDPCSSQPAQCYPPVRPWYEERLPASCRQPSHPSDSLIVQRRSQPRSGPGDLEGNGTTMYAVTLTRYRAGGAAMFLAEVRTGLARCATVARTDDVRSVRTTLTYRTLGAGLGGDESLLASRSFRYDHEGRPATYPAFLIAVVRIADVIAVVYDYGWEGSPSLRVHFDRFVAEALAEVRAGGP